MSYVYILKLSDGSYYTGSCRNIQIRIKNHKQKQVRSTKYKQPFDVIYTKKYNLYTKARKEEIRIKKWKKRSSIENLVKFDKNNIAAFV